MISSAVKARLKIFTSSTDPYKPPESANPDFALAPILVAGPASTTPLKLSWYSPFTYKVVPLPSHTNVKCTHSPIGAL